jgi:hypothetical protein
VTTAKRPAAWQPTILWPTREHWEEMCRLRGIGAGVSLLLEDYASQEVVAIMAALKPVRGRLNKRGNRKERQTIYCG